MRPGRRLLFAALVAGALAVPAAPSAQAKGSSSAKKPATPTKAPALSTDIARIEPLAPAGATTAPTLALDGVGEYRGLLEIRRVGAGVGAVNEVTLDDYLKGISEVPSSWPPEVLRAQAIAARTYLLWTLGNGAPGAAAALGAQICATESCQVYSGVAKERAANGERWAEAVLDTSGVALLSGGAPILAKYSACNGGRSVSGGKPYLKAIDDPDDAKCPLYRWGLAVSYDDIGRALAVPGTVKSVRAPGGDVEIDYTSDGGGGRLTVPRTAFRAKVGAAVPPPEGRSRTVPSIMFTLRPDDGGRVAVLDGRGFGHAIGMSQWGAYGKALRGLKAGAILAAYYGGIQPTKVPPSKLPAKVRVAIDDGKPAAPPAAKSAAAPGAPGGPDGAAPGKASKPKPADPKSPASGKAGEPAAAKPGAPPGGAADAVVSASGPFRILDSKGNVVVPVATGTWRIVPAGKGLKLVPPRDQAGAAGLTVLSIAPAAPLPGQPVTVRFKSKLPAIVSATAQAPGAPAAAPVLAAQVAGTEERRLVLPAASQPGPYAVTLTADAGPGRVATQTVTPAVLDPNAPPPSPGGGLLGLPPDAPLFGGGLLGLPPGARLFEGGLLGLPPGARLFEGGLLGLPPEARLFEGALAQSLLAPPPSDGTPAESTEPVPGNAAASIGGRDTLARASRSAAARPMGSSPSRTRSLPAWPALGAVLAASSGLLVRHLRRRSTPSAGTAPPPPAAAPGDAASAGDATSAAEVPPPGDATSAGDVPPPGDDPSAGEPPPVGDAPAGAAAPPSAF